MRSPRAAALWLTALLSVLGAAPAQAQDEPCQGPIELVNGSFEDPASVEKFSITPAQNVPGWDTTASDQKIEIWQDGYLGVPASDGEQFAELNANVPSELFQAQPTTPGALVAYRVFHRGREGVDTMEVRIGPPDGPPGFVRSVQTGKNAWVEVAGTYLVPPGQTSTRFGFAAIDTATGNLSIGNFLDGVEFSSSTCALTVTKALRPRDDPGRFNLLVDGVVRARRVGHGGTTGALPVPAGTALIRETVARGTRLSEYRSSMGCVHADGTVAHVVRGRSLELEFEPNDHVHCLVRNVRKGQPLPPLPPIPPPLPPVPEPPAPAVPVPPQRQAEISLRKTASPRTVKSGQPVRFRVAVQSLGPAAATDLLVCDRLPARLMLTHAPGARFRDGLPCWQVPRLASGKRRTFELTARAEARAGLLRNRVVATGANVAARIASASVRVRPSAPTPCPTRATVRRSPVARAAC